MHFWSIWHEKNRRVFEGVDTPQRFKDNFSKRLYFCDKGNFFYSSLDLVSLVDSFILDAYSLLSDASFASNLLLLIYKKLTLLLLKIKFGMKQQKK